MNTKIDIPGIIFFLYFFYICEILFLKSVLPFFLFLNLHFLFSSHPFKSYHFIYLILLLHIHLSFIPSFFYCYLRFFFLAVFFVIMLSFIYLFSHYFLNFLYYSFFITSPYPQLGNKATKTQVYTRV